ncbi:polysaccharide deacetylase family protein [Nostocoides sp. HKS02]|uniref:polysaccharide deacetylase family protein n=1 Tax=Nostocoides sp. HKS02 TaxID=1813880 RepID=UPI001E37CDA9|nr:polysaccharide deacetylase family protein [Tetrasphaera sp. HKS02]
MSIVLNVERWPFDQAMPRAILNPPHGAQPVPDVPNFSWAEQGMRLGLPRLVEIINARGLPAGVNLNAAAIDAYPQAAELLLQSDFEFIGHGVSQRILNTTDERSVVREAVDILTSYSGQRIRGWLGPGLQETFHTPDVLSECGLDYVCDWVVDEQAGMAGREAPTARRRAVLPRTERQRHLRGGASLLTRVRATCGGHPSVLRRRR